MMYFSLITRMGFRPTCSFTDKTDNLETVDIQANYYTLSSERPSNVLIRLRGLHLFRLHMDNLFSHDATRYY